MERQRKTGLFWFNNDLRVDDQAALCAAADQVDYLLCVFILDSDISRLHHYGIKNIGAAKRQFLIESLVTLNTVLQSFDQGLHIFEGKSQSTLNRLIKTHNITHVFRSDSSGFYENRIWSSLIKDHPLVSFNEKECITLFERFQLPFTLEELPATFTQFRKAVEKIEPPSPIAPVKTLPAPVLDRELATPNYQAKATSFEGGESSGKTHLVEYFLGDLPANYKQVRNSLDGWDNSTKLSPWLAHGCISPRQVLTCVRQYESSVVANESTYWITFELLWREYFQWNARLHQTKLFAYSGTKNIRPLTEFSAEQFEKWCTGTTPYPLVNACMKELRETGYLSNRGRQIVASCLVNELNLDWRYGAAYFESVLIDYDVASNWGNWQYLAGVGADVKDKRHFNLEKQTQLFDPRREYIRKWTNEDTSAAVDTAEIVN